jgi:large subunit ribosomal protein L29
MKVSEMRDLSSEEIGAKVEEKKQAFFNLRFQHGVAQLDNTSLLAKAKREIARLKTIQNAKVKE